MIKNIITPEKDKDSLLDIYRRVMLGEQVLKQRIIELIHSPRGITRKEKDIYYSMEEAAQGIRKIQGLDIEKQHIEVESNTARLLIEARKRKSSGEG